MSAGVLLTGPRNLLPMRHRMNMARNALFFCPAMMCVPILVGRASEYIEYGAQFIGLFLAS